MSDEGRGREEVVWLKGEVCLEYLSFVYVPDGNYMYFMCVLPEGEDWIELQARKGIGALQWTNKIGIA